LGSAQFGTGYGIYVKNPPVNNLELAQILNLAQKNGIFSIDCALNYLGVTENLAEQSQITNFKISSKIEYIESQELRILHSLQNSLSILNIKSYENILIHNWSELSFSGKNKSINFLRTIQDSGICLKIGISVYKTEELEEFNEKIEVVQAPLNFFDLRFLDSVRVLKIRDFGTEFIARSVFLQGILLHHTKAPKQFQNEMLKFKMYAKVNNFSLIQAALSIYDSQDVFSKLIIGINSIKELFEIISCPISLSRVNSANFLPVFSEDLIDPRRWNLRP
jgi:aryl-alcohol dehydrogenase-like predicted oxidoreductase